MFYAGILILYMGKNKVRVWQLLMFVVLVHDWKKKEPGGSERPYLKRV